MCAPINGQSGPVGAHPSEGRKHCSNAGGLSYRKTLTPAACMRLAGVRCTPLNSVPECTGSVPECTAAFRATPREILKSIPTNLTHARSDTTVVSVDVGSVVCEPRLEAG